jgi:hypothetical protein
MTQPAVLKLRPYWQIMGPDDDRKRPTHRKALGVVLPADHPFWRTAFPPFGYNCRERVVSRSQKWVDAHGGVSSPPTGLPDPGFTSGTQGLLVPDIEAINKQAAPQPKPKKEPKPIPPEHTQAHWEQQYATYGAAAPSLAHGRAMTERAVALPLRSFAAARRKLASTGRSLPGNLEDSAVRALRTLRASGQKMPATIGEAVERLEAMPRGVVGDQGSWLRAAATLTEHMQEVGGRALSLPVAAADAESTKFATVLFGDATRKVGAVMSPDARLTVSTMRYGVGENGRAFWDPQTLEVVAKNSRSAMHELGHAIESSDPAKAQAAQAFLAKRAEGRPLRRLREMDPLRGYSDDEMAFDCGFQDPYMGKSYAEGFTEVTSMGLESIADDGGAMLLADDPEYYHFVLGQLK